MPDFAHIQKMFTDRIRNQTAQSIDNIEDRRLAVYRELFFNNLESFIAGTFPVLKECLVENTWQDLIRIFFIKHACETPYFLEISEEFLHFIETDTQASAMLPEYGYSLAHWEWMELFADAYVETSNDEVLRIEFIESQSSVLTSIECAWLQAYEYPVHKISADVEINKEAAFLLVYRNSQDEVKFIELNPLSYLLFEAIKQNQSCTVEEIVSSLAVQQGLSIEQLLSGAIAIIEDWNQKKLLKVI